MKPKPIKDLIVLFLSSVDYSDCAIGIGCKDFGNTEIVYFDLKDLDKGLFLEVVRLTPYLQV